MAPPGFLDRPVELESSWISGNSRQRQPVAKRLPVAITTSWPASAHASASGIIGYRCPYAPSEANMIFTWPCCQTPPPGVTCWRLAPRGLGTVWTTLHLRYEKKISEHLKMYVTRLGTSETLPDCSVR